MKRFIITILLLLSARLAFAQTTITGRIFSEDQQPVNGATIRLKEGQDLAISTTDGSFSIKVPGFPSTLQVTHIGYRPLEIPLTELPKKAMAIVLHLRESQMGEVTVSTGYQQLPAERATGSFSKVGPTLIDRRVSTDIVSRLEDAVPGLTFNRGKGTGPNDISIRGRGTLFANTQPLIVIDNFPYEGDLNNINPNDVESISVLKDAAAASIWGARAGNGVIVITTRKSRYNQPVKISLNTNITVGEKPDLFYQPVLSTSDYIDIEKQLFDKGFYNARENSFTKQALTPVVELLFAKRRGTISAAEADARIEALKSQDVRKDFERYFLRKTVKQQYAINLSGGNAYQKYYLSAGYDKNLDGLVRNGYQRVTLNAGNTFSLLKDKLELTTGIYYVSGKTQLNNDGPANIFYFPGSGLYPYARLADDAGNPTVVNKQYNERFINLAPGAGLLNWQYRPLEDLRLADNQQTLTDYRLDAGLKYRIIPGLSAQLLYRYGKTINLNDNRHSVESFYTRNLINIYTQKAGTTLTRGIPLGDILDEQTGTAVSQNLRAQLDFQRTFGTKHEINAIAGTETRDLHTINNLFRLYGYDNEHATSQPVNYLTAYGYYFNPIFRGTIPNIDARRDLTDRFRSYYANAAYTYDRRLTFSGSIRFDESNLFGVNTNQKRVPLYSLGGSWNIDRESFYHIEWLPYLKLRATYGYNGNIDKSSTAYVTGTVFGNSSLNNDPYVQISNPANPNLRWERIRIENLGVDFGTKDNRLTGSVDYYQKTGNDLIGDVTLAPSTGFPIVRQNFASTKGSGVDFNINGQIFKGKFQWLASLLYSHQTEKVTRYGFEDVADNFLLLGDGSGIAPLVGRPLLSVYSYRWAGLDPATGDPQGYLNGAVSKDYNAIINNSKPADLVYNGPARPTTFGALRNTFSYGAFSLSATINYRLGYYFRRNGLNYGTILLGNGGHGDYNKRWQQPGDEAHTDIPSMPAVNNDSRNRFYFYASSLVEKADNIRLQDINLSYELRKATNPWLPFVRLQLYLYANNIATIWKATKTGLDPDYPLAAYPPVRTIAAGLKADF